MSQIWALMNPSLNHALADFVEALGDCGRRVKWTKSSQTKCKRKRLRTVLLAIQNGNDFFDTPKMIGNACGHCRTDPEALVDAYKVVPAVVNSQRCDMMLDLPRERICQAREPANMHPQS